MFPKNMEVCVCVGGGGLTYVDTQRNRTKGTPKSSFRAGDLNMRII